MIMLNTFRILMSFTFTLFTGSTCAMQSGHNMIEKSAGEGLWYKDCFCELRISLKNEKLNPLSNNESIFCQKFLAQMIKNCSGIRSEYIEEFARREFSGLEAQYLDGIFLFATAKNNFNQLLGVMFFYTENDNTEATIQSLSTNNIEDKILYQKLCSGMSQLIQKTFPSIHTIRILELTVPENLKSTLKKLGFKCNFINRKKDDFLVKFSVLQLEISRWNHWCTLL